MRARGNVFSFVVSLFFGVCIEMKLIVNETYVYSRYDFTLVISVLVNKT